MDGILNSRNRALWGYLAVAAFVGALTWWTRVANEPMRRDEFPLADARNRAVDPAEVLRPGVATDRAQAKSDATSMRAPADVGQAVQVRIIVRNPSGGAVPGARVALIARPLIVNDLDVWWADSVIASGVATDDGSVVLDATIDAVYEPISERNRGASRQWIVLVSHSDFVGVSSPIELSSSKIERTVTLLPPQRIRGVIVDRGGAPISAVSIVAVPEHWPMGAERSSATGAGIGSVRAVSGGDGRFELLVASGRYRIAIASGKWDVARDDSSGRAGATWARSGDVDVRLVVDPIRIARLRFLDKRTGKPVAAPLPHFDVTFDPQYVRFIESGPGARVGAGEMELRAGPILESPSSLVFILRMESGTERLTSVPIRFGPMDYQPGAAAVEIGVFGTDETDRQRVTDVEITPNAGLPRRDLDCVVRDPGPPEGFSVSPEHLLSLDYQGGGGIAVQGRSLGAGRWSFDGVPAGRHRAHVGSGFGVDSESFDLELPLPAGREPELSYADRAWLAFAMFDSAGRRVFDADTLVLSRVESKSEKSLLPDLTSIGVREGAVIKPPVCTCDPGKYVAYATRDGIGGKSEALEAVRGRVTVIEIHLRANPAQQPHDGAR